MSARSYRLAAVVLAAGLPSLACAASDADLEAIRVQIQTLKQDYDARIQALEARLKAAEMQAAQAKSQAQQAKSEAEQVAAAPVVSAPAPTATSATQGLAAFNPAISAVLNGTYANLSRDPNQWHMAGFLAGGETGPGRRGFSLGESELGFQANVDPLFSGNLIFSITPENTVSVEEAYGIYRASAGRRGAEIRPLLLRPGLPQRAAQPRLGLHRRAARLPDAPRAASTRTTACRSSGSRRRTSSSSWAARSATATRTRATIATRMARVGVAFVHVGGDVGFSNSWRAGVSYLQTGARSRESAVTDAFGNDATASFSGQERPRRTRTSCGSGRPTAIRITRNFKLQGEYMWRQASAETSRIDAALALRARERGAVLLAPERASTRRRSTSSCRSGASARATTGSIREASTTAPTPRSSATASFHPQRTTVMVDWTPSEFSRVRVQFGRRSSRPGFTDKELFVQYILSLGAHGAHNF